jgi:hypothetical protein
VTVTLGKHGALFSWQLAGGSGQIMSHMTSPSFVVRGEKGEAEVLFIAFASTLTALNVLCQSLKNSVCVWSPDEGIRTCYRFFP